MQQYKGVNLHPSCETAKALAAGKPEQAQALWKDMQGREKLLIDNINQRFTAPLSAKAAACVGLAQAMRYLEAHPGTKVLVVADDSVTDFGGEFESLYDSEAVWKTPRIMDANDIDDYPDRIRRRLGRVKTFYVGAVSQEARDAWNLACARHDAYEDNGWDISTAPFTLCYTNPKLLFTFEACVRAQYPAAAAQGISTFSSYFILNSDGVFELDGVRTLWNAFVEGRRSVDLQAEAEALAYADKLSPIGVIDLGLAVKHSMPCAVYPKNHAVYDMNTGVYKPSWSAKANGWHLIHANNWFKKWLLRFFKD